MSRSDVQLEKAFGEGGCLRFGTRFGDSSGGSCQIFKAMDFQDSSMW